MSRGALKWKVALPVVCVLAGGVWLWKPRNPEAVPPSASLPPAPAAVVPPCHQGFVPQTVQVRAIQPASTLKMIERLQAAWQKAKKNPLEFGPFASAEKAGFFRARMTEEPDARKKLALQGSLMEDLLRAGKNEESLEMLDQFEAGAAGLGHQFDAPARANLVMLRAVAHLRIGEQENCLGNHNADSCLLPLRGGGIHRLPRGSRGAITVLTEWLTQHPGDLHARWLLNIAAMTLGEYPEKVPPAWLIPPRAFESEYDIKRFPQVAAEAGLDVNGLAGGSIVEDFDGDGLLDVMVSEWQLTGQLRLLRSNGDGTFTERTDEAWLTGLTGALNMMQTDYNNDGWPDVFILRGAWQGAAGHFPKSLLRNNGDGTFTDVTEEAALLSLRPSQAATWFDFNGDGWLDVFIGNESIPGDPNPCELYRNNGNGTFTGCALESGVAIARFIKAVSSGDYNQDGRPDLYLSNRGGPNLLFRNDGPAVPGGGARGKWKFTDVTEAAGLQAAANTFPTWFWDYDNDGWQDIMVTGYAVESAGDFAADCLGLPHSGERARLYRNNRDGTFRDVSATTGVSRLLFAMSASYGDLDNDGWLDFYLGTGDPNMGTLIPNRMFRSDAGRRFQDVTTSGGFGHLQKGHGISFADLDNDGDQDIHAVMGGAYSGDLAHNALFLNPGHGHHWITLKLEGVTSNRAAIGARIRIIVQTAEGERSIYKTVGTGASFGASPLRQEIGLGNATAIRKVEILWPATGRTQSLTGLEMDRFHKIREDDTSAITLEVKKFTLPAAGGHSAD